MGVWPACRRDPPRGAWALHCPAWGAGEEVSPSPPWPLAPGPRGLALRIAGAPDWPVPGPLQLGTSGRTGGPHGLTLSPTPTAGSISLRHLQGSSGSLTRPGQGHEVGSCPQPAAAPGLDQRLYRLQFASCFYFFSFLSIISDQKFRSHPFSPPETLQLQPGTRVEGMGSEGARAARGPAEPAAVPSGDACSSKSGRTPPAPLFTQAPPPPSALKPHDKSL